MDDQGHHRRLGRWQDGHGRPREIWDRIAEEWAEESLEADVDEVVKALDHKNDVCALVTFDGVNKAV